MIATRHAGWFGALGIACLCTVGCADRAQPFHEDGVAAEAAGNLEDAKAAYANALAADSESEFGTKSAERLEVVELALKKRAVGQARAKEKAEKAAERRRLLGSDDPADWKRLTVRHAESDEAKAAAKKLVQNASLCADLDTWTNKVERETAALGQVHSRYKRKNLLASGPLELLKISGEMRKESKQQQVAAEKARARLEQHGLSEGEAAFRSELSMALLDISLVWKMYEEAFRAGTKGFGKLSQIDLYAAGELSRTNDRRVRAAKGGCANPSGVAKSTAEALTPKAAKGPCTPCSSQEDFDAAMKRKSRCCPVIACRGDSDCSGGRVCCKIPDGQLCGDASRCPSSERVR